MNRYMVNYSKNEFVATLYCKTVEQAIEKQKMLESVGYNVTIWECTKSGARPYGKTLSDCFKI